MAVKTLLPGAWSLRSDAEFNLFTLNVPTSWQQAAQALALKRYQTQGKGYPSVPNNSLDPIVTASFPQIIKTERNAWKNNGNHWIVAKEQVDLCNLPELVKNWLREEFLCLGEDEVESTLSRLDDQLWEWNEETLVYPLQQLLAESQKNNLCFSAIPDYLAEELLTQPEICFEGKNHSFQLKFYRVIKLGQAAELMSWPPTEVTVLRRGEQVGIAKISFVISFSVQTLPWRTEPVVYHTLSVRRWIYKPFKRLPYPGATVHIGDSHRWLDGERQTLRFMPIRAQRLNGELIWPRALKEILTINDSKLPDMQDIIQQPDANWHSENSSVRGIQTAIAYHSSYSSTSEKELCLGGVSPRDLASLDQAIRDHLPIERVGKANLLTPFKSAKDSKLKGLWDSRSGKRNIQMIQPEIAQDAVVRLCNQNILSILIVWETESCRDAIIYEICQLLDLHPTNDKQIYSGVMGSLRIQTLHVSDLTQPLDIPAKLSLQKKQQLRKKIMEERIQEIVNYLPKSIGLSGAIIEIKSKKYYFPREADPKLAWRIGAMRQGYPNQHIHALTPSKSKKKIEADQERIRRAVLDLLRQLGAMPSPVVAMELDGVSSNLWLTCLHVIRRNRRTTANGQPVKVAIMVRVNAATGEVQLTTSSIFNNQGWLSYPEGLKRLLNEKWADESWFESTEETLSSDRRQTEQHRIGQFLSQCLKSCLNLPAEGKELPRVLFMASAQNARELLPWLTNPQLPKNSLPEGLARQLNNSECDRLWVVRIRELDRGETPVVITEGDPGARSSIGGIFQWQGVFDSNEDTLYLSLRNLLKTEQNVLRKSQSRLDNGGAPAANPKPLEIAVIHHPDIEEERLVSLVHALRNRWPYFADDVSLPLPFTFAIKAKEYAVSPQDMIDASETDSEDSDDADLD
ncbi:MAG: DUF3962 domain-containing protein [Aphanothece sp. CMT-3BRIN-NPC111]|jgi:hypothetical protein|nr:DUF3962 domain-containing protein [Aphanothece sp. CMT-3BRIN-NPC111]